MGFLLISLPGAVTSWWGLFDDRPFLAVVRSQLEASVMPDIDPLRLTQVILPLVGFLLLGAVVFEVSIRPRLRSRSATGIEPRAVPTSAPAVHPEDPPAVTVSQKVAQEATTAEAEGQNSHLAPEKTGSPVTESRLRLEPRVFPRTGRGGDVIGWDAVVRVVPLSSSQALTDARVRVTEWGTWINDKWCPSDTLRRFNVGREMYPVRLARLDDADEGPFRTSADFHVATLAERTQTAYIAVREPLRERWPMNGGRYGICIEVEVENVDVTPIAAWFAIDVRTGPEPLRFRTWAGPDDSRPRSVEVNVQERAEHRMTVGGDHYHYKLSSPDTARGVWEMKLMTTLCLANQTDRPIRILSARVELMERHQVGDAYLTMPLLRSDDGSPFVDLDLAVAAEPVCIDVDGATDGRLGSLPETDLVLVLDVNDGTQHLEERTRINGSPAAG